MGLVPEHQGHYSGTEVGPHTGEPPRTEPPGDSHPSLPKLALGPPLGASIQGPLGSDLTFDTDPLLPVPPFLFFFFVFFSFLHFLGLNLRHMEVPWLGVKLEL